MPPVVSRPFLLGRLTDRHQRNVLDTHNLALRPKQYPPLVIGPLDQKLNNWWLRDPRIQVPAPDQTVRTRALRPYPISSTDRVSVVCNVMPDHRSTYCRVNGTSSLSPLAAFRPHYHTLMFATALR